MAPTPWESLCDRLAVLLHGGVRVRVLNHDPATGVVLGHTLGRVEPERILHEILNLKPPGSGTIDLVHTHGSHYKIWLKGALSDPRWEQRLRNVLGNV